MQADAAELAAVLARRWDVATLEALGEFSSLASTVDARLLSFDDGLFAAVQRSGALMAWYRLTPDEQNFTTSPLLKTGGWFMTFESRPDTL